MLDVFFNKVAGLRRTALSKKRLQQMCFPVNFLKFFKAAFSEKDENKFVSYRYSDEMIVGTCFS